MGQNSQKQGGPKVGEDEGEGLGHVPICNVSPNLIPLASSIRAIMRTEP